MFHNGGMVNATRRLPLFAALGAFVLYAGTAGVGVTLTNLSLAAKVAGWDTTPIVGQPLLWLFTLPLHLLPAAWVPLALKLFSASLAALVVGLLTRTTQLLPWDRPWDNASRLACVLPLLTAGGVCGLEFGFWQEATAGSGEMLDLLLLATALWLLLEYHVRREARWLDAAVVVWGLGMAENWLMLLALPLFVVAVMRLQGRRFFRLNFILRLAGLGLAAFSIYAVLPLANGLAPHSPWTFDQAWLASLRQTKNLCLMLYYKFWREHRLLTFAVALCFLVPTLPLLVRLRDEGTDNLSQVDRLQIWLYRGLRGLLLLACVWLALDPATGPQQLVQHQAGIGMPMLTFDYLNALGAGFLAGNLLLISQSAVQRRRRQSGIAWRQLTVPGAALGLTLILTVLVVRNAPAIWRVNFHPLQQFGDQVAKALPAGGGVMLSDEPQKLAVFQAALAHRPAAADWLAVNTRALPSVAYRARLERRQPGWLTDATRHELTPLETTRLLEQVAATNRLFYLHPSYGVFFERFYLEPAGLIFEMKRRGKNPLAIPAWSPAATEANEKFWTELWNRDLAELVPSADQRPGGLEKRLQRFGYRPVSQVQDRVLAEWYSMALDAWGVRLQQQGRWPAARLRFDQAQQLNTNNLSARASLFCNAKLQAGDKMGLADVTKAADQLGKLNHLSQILNTGGPFDEPTFCYLLGTLFQQTGMLWQAAEQFERTRTLVADTLAPEFALADLYNRLQQADRARPLIDHLRVETKKLPANSALDLDLALLDSYCWLAQSNAVSARQALQAVVAQHPDDGQIAHRVVEAYVEIGDFADAWPLVEAQLAKTPDDVPSLNSQALILIQTGRAAAALLVLDHVLVLTNLPAARINHAFARLLSQDFAAAEREYRELEKSGKNSDMVSYGLAAVAEHRLDTNQAVHYFQLCLTNTPAGSALWRQASAHLQTLTSGTNEPRAVPK